MRIDVSFINQRLFGVFFASVILSTSSVDGFGSDAEIDKIQRQVNEEAFQQRFDRVENAPETDFSEFRRLGSDKPMLDSDVNWKVVLMTGDDSIRAFDNARRQLASMFEDYGVDPDNTIHLSRSRSEAVGDVRPTSISNFEEAFADLDIGEGDGCAVFMTSHGTTQGFYIRGQSYLTPSRLDQILDRYCGERPTVLMVSACYSGVFAESFMETPNRIILTAARRDRTSFGCSSEAVYTYWDGCLITELPGSDTWADAYINVTECIERKEAAGGFRRSYPQARFGADVESLGILGRMQ